MRKLHTSLIIAFMVLSSACTELTPPTAPHTWQTMMVRVQRDMGLRMLGQIRSSPQPAAAQPLLAPAITLLIRGQLYKEARRLAGTAINAFPNNPLYHQLLADAYRATIEAGEGSRRTEKKMHYELERVQQLSR